MVKVKVNGCEKIVIFGGTGGHGVAADDLHVYDSVTNAWSQPQMSGVKPLTNYPGNGAPLCTSQASLNGVLYVLDEMGYFSKLDVSTWNWTRLDSAAGVTGSPPGTLQSPGMAAIDSLNCVVVFGGKITGTDRSFSKTLSVFNASSKVWTLMDDGGFWGNTGSTHSPDKKKVSSMTVMGNRIFIFGEDTKLYMFDFDSKGWMVVHDGTGTAPRSRADFGMVAVGGKLMMYGGSVLVTPWDVAPTAEFWEFDVDERRWTMLPLGPTARSKHKMVEYMGSTIIFGGNVDVTGATNEFLVFTPPLHHYWPNVKGISSELAFRNVYDLDVLHLNNATSLKDELELPLNLCSNPWLPCALTVHGPGSIKVDRLASISCDSAAGCSQVTLFDVELACVNKSRASGLLQVSASAIASASINLFRSSIVGCSSDADGGSIRAFSMATLVLRDVVIRNSVSRSRGGAIALVGASMNMINSTFERCHADGAGGCVWMSKFERYPEQPVYATAGFTTSTFFQSSSRNSGGGALALEDLSSASVTDATFHRCVAATKGGAMQVASGSSVDVSGCNFTSNIALGMGGGACSIIASRSTFRGNTFDDNQATSGGGGAVLWEGSVVPGIYREMAWQHCANEGQICTCLGTARYGHKDSGTWREKAATGWIECSTNHFGNVDPKPGQAKTCECKSQMLLSNFSDHATICHGYNMASYGPCIATPYHRLNLTGAPTAHAPGYAGVMVSLVATKLDQYDQIINTDSTSTLQAYTGVKNIRALVYSSENDLNSALMIEPDPLVILLVSTIARLQAGRAYFSLELKPTFESSSISFGKRPELMIGRTPHLYLKGEDATIQGTMTSELIPIPLSLTPCPQGSVLSLDPGDCTPSQDCLSKYPRRGVCAVCKPGTYSLDPLASPHGFGTDPACLKCPAGGDCTAGGSIVQFKRGDWFEENGTYVLKSCPQGYKVVTTGSDIVAIHDSQICEVCGKVR
jgi:hypothetical protein